MIRSKGIYGVLGVCAAALVMVVFFSGGAQAESGANWMVNGTKVNASLLPSVEIFELVNKKVTLSTKIAGASVEFVCTSAAFIGAKLETEGKVTSGNTTQFSGCSTIINGKLAEGCTPTQTGKPKGTVESAPLKGLLILNEGKGIVLFEPVTGETFLPLTFNISECSLPEKCPIKGKQSVKDSKGELGTELVSHTVEQGPVSELFVISNTAEHKVNVAGSAVLRLGGAHAGIQWSGVPG